MDSSGEILRNRRLLEELRLSHSMKPFVPASGGAQRSLVPIRKVSCRLMLLRLLRSSDAWATHCRLCSRLKGSDITQRSCIFRHLVHGSSFPTVASQRTLEQGQYL